MPIYEYKCENGHVFDVLQRISDDPLEECIECSASVRKVLHPVGISFKGSGFYSTDYKSDAKTEASDKAPARNGDSGTKSGSEGDGAAKKPEKANTDKSTPSGSTT